MKSYTIAKEDGRSGHAQTTLRVEINLGLKQGYDGFAQEKKSVLNFLTDLYKKQIVDGGNYIPFVVSEAVITYAFRGDDGPVAAHEPSLVLTSDKSPLYQAETEDEWKAMVEGYVFSLGTEFKQFRVYLTYMRVELKIFQQGQYQQIGDKRRKE